MSTRTAVTTVLLAVLALALVWGAALIAILAAALDDCEWVVFRSCESRGRHRRGIEREDVPMDAAAHFRHARAEGERIAEVGAGADVKVPVPTMPGNDLGSLLLHTGGFCRFVRSAIEQAKMPDLDFSDVGDDALAWHRREHTRLVETLDAADPQESGWSWGHDQRKAFWFRRAAQELAVHRWDAENALDVASPIDARLAVDGIDEFLVEFGRDTDVFERSGAASLFGGAGETIHFHATELPENAGAGEFLVTCHPDRFEITREHGKGDAAARGAASDLLLFVWGRIPPDRLEVHGDLSILERWADRVKL